MGRITVVIDPRTKPKIALPKGFRGMRKYIVRFLEVDEDGKEVYNTTLPVYPNLGHDHWPKIEGGSIVAGRGHRKCDGCWMGGMVYEMHEACEGMLKVRKRGKNRYYCSYFFEECYPVPKVSTHRRIIL